MLKNCGLILFYISSGVHDAEWVCDEILNLCWSDAVLLIRMLSKIGWTQKVALIFSKMFERNPD